MDTIDPTLNSGLDDSSHQIAGLVRQVQVGGPAAADAMTMLLARFEPLVRATAARYCPGKVYYEDAQQEARMAVWKAGLHYDFAHGVPFAAYVQRAVINTVGDFVAAENRQWPTVTEVGDHAADAVGSDLATAPDAILDQLVLVDLYAALDSREQFVVQRVYGQDATRSSVAVSLGVSPTTVTNILIKVAVKGQAYLVPREDITT